MELGGSMSHYKGSPIIHILSRINPIPQIDIQFCKFHSNIVLPSMFRPSKDLFPIGLPVNILKALQSSSTLATS